MPDNDTLEGMTTTPTIMQGAEPFYFAGGRIGCLCIHGLSASPQEVYWLGKHLAAQGATVYGPRLYGHGISPEYLWRVRWRDWYLSALDGYHLLKQQCERVFVMGLSMGGVLSLLLAANIDVAGVIAMAAPLRFNASPARAHALRYVLPAVFKMDKNADPLNHRIAEMQQQRGERVTGRVAYYEHASAGIAELHRLQAEAARALPNICVPALLIYSESDQTVPISNLNRVAHALTGSPDVRTLRLKLSDHIITNDVEYEQVLSAAWDFVSDVSEAGGAAG